MELQDISQNPTTDSPESLRHAALVVGVWLMALTVLPPSGLLWQTGVFNTVGSWLMSRVLAGLHLTGFFL